MSAAPPFNSSASSRDSHPTTAHAASAYAFNPAYTLPYHSGLETFCGNQYLPTTYPPQSTYVYAANRDVGCQTDGFPTMDGQYMVPPEYDSAANISSAYPSSSYHASPENFPPGITLDDDVSCAGSVCSCTQDGRVMNPREDYNMTKVALKVNNDVFRYLQWMSEQSTEQCCYVVSNLQCLISQIKEMQEDQYQLTQMIAKARACSDSQSSVALTTRSL